MEEEVIESEVKEVRKGRVKGQEPLEPLTIKIDPGLKAQIEAVAEQDGKSPSEVAREFLEKSLSANPDRKRAALLRSVAITRGQLEKALEEDPDESTIFFPGPRVMSMRRSIRSLKELEHALKE